MSAAARPPLWLRVFDGVERPVGDVVSACTRSGAFADMFALSVRLQRRLQREVDRFSGRALHGANLPAASDMRRVSKQIAQLERQVRDLSRRLDEQGDPRGGRART